MADCKPECRYCNPPPVHCDKCRSLIPYASNVGNLDGGMRLRFEGWYGGTIDPFIDTSLTLCASCATSFLRENAWAAETYHDLAVSHD